MSSFRVLPSDVLRTYAIQTNPIPVLLQSYQETQRIGDARAYAPREITRISECKLDAEMLQDLTKYVFMI